jgi:hypothetical protein
MYKTLVLTEKYKQVTLNNKSLKAFKSEAKTLRKPF